MGRILVLLVALLCPAWPETEAETSETLEQQAEEVRQLLKNQRRTEAKALARHLYEETREAFGPESVESADALDLLVSTLYLGGEYRNPETMAHAEEAVALRERLHGLSHPAVAASLYRLARLYYFDLRRTEALALVERSLTIREETLGPLHPDVAESLRFLGTLYDEKGESERGRGYLERSVEIREAALEPDHPDLAQSLNYLANCLLRLGEYEEALGLYERAQGIFERALGEESSQAAKALYNQALVLTILADYPAARARYERSLEVHIAALGPEHSRVFITRSGLAGLLQEIGDYAGARVQLEHVLEGIERTLGADQPYYATTLSSLGSLLEASGDLDEALEVHERTLRIRSDALGPSHPDVAASLSDIARLLHLEGSRTRARTLFEQALEIQEASLGEDHPRVADTLTGLARTFDSPTDRSEARALYQRAVAILETAFGADHPRLIGPLLGAGELQELAGEPDRARRLFGRSLEIAEAVGGEDLPVVARILHADARTSLRMKRWDEALEVALRGAEVAQSHVRATARALPEREALAYAGYMKDNLDLALSVATFDSDKVSDAPSRVWDSLIRSRALVLDEMAARQRTAIRSADPGVRRLVEELSAARQRLANLMVRGPHDLAPGHHRELVAKARKERERAELALADRSREFRARLARERAGLEEVRARLPERSGLLAYSLFDRRYPSPPEAGGEAPAVYVALVLRADRPKPGMVLLGTAEDVDALVGGWRRAVRASHAVRDETTAEAVAPHTTAGWALRAKVWDPIASELDGLERVFVVPDGSLNLVNLAALPSGLATYLVETGPTLHLLSAERELAEQAPPPEGEGLLVIGAPDFELRRPAVSPSEEALVGGPGAGPNATKPSACGSLQSVRFEPLPASLREVREVAAVWSGDRNLRPAIQLTGEEATEGAFKSLAPQQRILHLATHGFFLGGPCVTSSDRRRGIGGLVSSDSPPPVESEPPLLLSGLALAGANHRYEDPAAKDDGIVTAEEIASLDLLNVEWVVLSACDTGVGEIRAGEGVFGLRRALRVAGTRTVIMSLWSVQDEATEQWMKRLYRARFYEGLDTAAAVRQASLGLLAELREKRRSAHPALWAGFVASGDWR